MVDLRTGREEGEGGREGPREGRQGQGEEVEEVDVLYGEAEELDGFAGGRRAHTWSSRRSPIQVLAPARIPLCKP